MRTRTRIEAHTFLINKKTSMPMPGEVGKNSENKLTSVVVWKDGRIGCVKTSLELDGNEK